MEDGLFLSSSEKMTLSKIHLELAISGRLVCLTICHRDRKFTLEVNIKSSVMVCDKSSQSMYYSFSHIQLANHTEFHDFFYYSEIQFLLTIVNSNVNCNYKRTSAHMFVDIEV